MNAHPLVQRLAETPGAQWVTPDTLDAWLAPPATHVLFFGGDPRRFPEALDVAVVLPELRSAFEGRFDIGVIASEHEDVLARRYGVQRWPALVFLRGGGWLATLAGMRDWSDYRSAIAAALERAPARPPSVGIPVQAEGPLAGSCP